MNEDTVQLIQEADEELSRKVIQTYLNKDDSDKKIGIIHNDNELRQSDIDSMKIHNQYFNSLLNAYVNSARDNLKNKVFLKKVFFWVCIAILSLITLSILIITFVALFDEKISNSKIVVTLIANILSFMTSFIILPQTIANYLFNNDEEKNMTDIIKSIQDYDKNIRNKLD